jgi:UDP-N-acetylmuramoyl-tripeptide--D-alanyl-D-alanine ligase
MSDSANISFDDLVGSTGGVVVQRGASTRFDGAGIDGRETRPGDIYFAILGDTFDGHRFCEQAIAAGATALVISRDVPAPPAHVTVVKVGDTRDAIGRLSLLVRRRATAKVVGVTGSSGKTTTKELLAAALAAVAGADRVVASEGSLNNETGVPRTLLRLRPRHEFAVVEMGMRGLGHIAYLTRWAEPDVGLVLNAGLAHVGVVGSVGAIARGKSEIWMNGCAAVYPADDPRLAAHARAQAQRRFTFGGAGATVAIDAVEPRGPEGSDARLAIDGRPYRVRVPIVGRHNVTNAAAAMAVAVALGVDLERAAAGIADARPAQARSQVRVVGGRNVLVDCYNANPASMRAAIETTGELARGARAVAVLGDMLELGEREAEEHEQVGGLLGGFAAVVTLGERARHIAQGARAAGAATVAEAADPEDAARRAAAATRAGDWILVKASRGMKLERVVAALEKVAG